MPAGPAPAAIPVPPRPLPKASPGPEAAAIRPWSRRSRHFQRSFGKRLERVWAKPHRQMAVGELEDKAIYTVRGEEHRAAWVP